MQDGFIGKYAIGGAFGALFYLEPIETSDIDIFIHLEPSAGALLVSLDPIMERLESLGYTEWIEDRQVVEGCPIQFVPVARPLEIEALFRAERHTLTETVKPFVFSPEYLMAIALDLSRPKDRIRLERFLRQNCHHPAALADIFKRHKLEEKWARVKSLLSNAPPLYPSSE